MTLVLCAYAVASVTRSKGKDEFSSFCLQVTLSRPAGPPQACGAAEARLTAAHSSAATVAGVPSDCVRRLKASWQKLDARSANLLFTTALVVRLRLRRSLRFHGSGAELELGRLRLVGNAMAGSKVRRNGLILFARPTVRVEDPVTARAKIGLNITSISTVGEKTQRDSRV